MSPGFNLFSFNGYSSSFSVIVHFNVLHIDMVKKNMRGPSSHHKWTIFVKTRNWGKLLPLPLGNKSMNRRINTVYILTMSELSGVTSNLLIENLPSSDLLTRFKPCLLSISLEWVSYHFTVFPIFTNKWGPVWCPPEKYQTTCWKIPDE